MLDGGDLTTFIKNRRSKLISENQIIELFVQISLGILGLITDMD